jgi:hypothetical protein
MLALGEREAPEIAAQFPHVQRRVGGYNLDALTPQPVNNWRISWSAPKAPSSPLASNSSCGR